MRNPPFRPILESLRSAAPGRRGFEFGTRELLIDWAADEAAAKFFKP